MFYQRWPHNVATHVHTYTKTHIHTYRRTDIQTPHNVTLYLHAKPTVLIYTFNPTMYLVQVCVCVCVCACVRARARVWCSVSRYVCACSQRQIAIIPPLLRTDLRHWGGGGVLPYAYWVCACRARDPHSQPYKFPFRSIIYHFHKSLRSTTILYSFCRSRDLNFRNFAAHGRLANFYTVGW